jgi:hypothetical protein
MGLAGRLISLGVSVIILGPWVLNAAMKLFGNQQDKRHAHIIMQENMFLDPGSVTEMAKQLIRESEHSDKLILSTMNCLRVRGPQLKKEDKFASMNQNVWCTKIAESIVMEVMPAIPWIKRHTELEGGEPGVCEDCEREVQAGALITRSNGMLIVRVKNQNCDDEKLIEDWVVDVYVCPRGQWKGSFFAKDDGSDWEEDVDVTMEVYKEYGDIDMTTLLHYCGDGAMHTFFDRVRVKKVDRLTAFAMALHPRLGELSIANVLGKDIASLIGAQVHDDDEPIEWAVTAWNGME